MWWAPTFFAQARIVRCIAPPSPALYSSLFPVFVRYNWLDLPARHTKYRPPLLPRNNQCLGHPHQEDCFGRGIGVRQHPPTPIGAESDPAPAHVRGQEGAGHAAPRAHVSGDVRCPLPPVWVRCPVVLVAADAWSWRDAFKRLGVLVLVAFWCVASAVVLFFGGSSLGVGCANACSSMFQTRSL